MGKLKTQISVRGTVKEVEPIGINSLTVNINREGDFAFYRQKYNGSLSFVNSDFGFLKIAENDCCVKLPVSVSRTCGNADVLAFRGFVNTKKIEWNFETCEVKIDTLESEDIYTEIFKVWERKINMCAMVPNRTVRHWHRVTTLVGDTEHYTYPTATNTKGRLFSDWIYYNVQQALTGTPAASAIPANKNQLSYFLTADTNPCTGQKNQFLKATIFQNSDVLYPLFAPATGIEIDGTINENAAVSMKELFEELKAAFSLEWFVDSDTGKLRLEHTSFFENGNSYTAPGIGIDFSDAKYSRDFSKYRYSYKNSQEDTPGVEELILSQNESANQGERSVIVPIFTENSGTEYFYEYANINDFSLGNIKYASDCITVNEKGEVNRSSVTCSLFCTHAHAILMKSEAIDQNKWVLFDITTNIINHNLIKSGTCERTTLTNVPNAGFSATALMRNYHRWKRPFNRGLMSYSDTPAGLIGKGFLRDMFSVKFSKEYKEVEVLFCCGDSFDVRKLVKLPNGEIVRPQNVSVDYYNDRLRFKPLGLSACGSAVSFPDELEETDVFPAYGTLLNSYTVEMWCSALTNIGTEENPECRSFDYLIEGMRFIYADGFGGSYVEETFPECPQNDPGC